MDSKQMLLRVPNDLYYQLTAYAEQERRSISNATQYILQKFFEDHPVDYMEGGHGR